MVCEVCRHDAPYTSAQLAHRRQQLINWAQSDPTIGIYPCPVCGGRDYMLSTINIDQEPPQVYEGMLTNRPIRLAKQIRPRRSWWYRLGEWWRRLW